jgi:hypothetical protein
MEQKKIRMYMGIPTTGTICDAQTYVLRELQEKYGDKIEFVYPSVCIRRVFHDYARNSIVEEFLDSGCDVLWFLDSDVAPSKHVLDLIVLHWDKWVVAGAPYPVFITPESDKGPQVVFTVYKGGNGVGLAPANIPPEGLDYVDGIATGCLFIKREVFDKLQKPYFEFKYDHETRIMTEGEDLGFCKKLGALGIKFFIDYSMVCKHYKQVCLLDVNNYAVEYANRAVLAYDRDIRPKVDALVARLKAKTGTDRPQPQSKSKLILPSDFR